MFLFIQNIKIVSPTGFIDKISLEDIYWGLECLKLARILKTSGSFDVEYIHFVLRAIAQKFK